MQPAPPYDAFRRMSARIPPRGFDVLIVGDPRHGEVREVAAMHVAPPAWGGTGERTTVVARGSSGRPAGRDRGFCPGGHFGGSLHTRLSSSTRSRRHCWRSSRKGASAGLFFSPGCSERRCRGERPASRRGDGKGTDDPLRFARQAFQHAVQGRARAELFDCGRARGRHPRCCRVAFPKRASSAFLLRCRGPCGIAR